MTNFDDDTIVAIASGTASAAIGVIRVSGAQVKPLISKVLGRELKPRYATYTDLRDLHGEVLDEVIAIFFPAPNSATGEDLLEIHGHGSPLILSGIVDVLVNAGARHAQPGEFTKRAFLNGKLDLIQAEAVADLIATNNRRASRAALRSIKGEFSDRINALVAAITQRRVWLESAIDFSDDVEIADISGGTKGFLDQLHDDLHTLKSQCVARDLLDDGLRVALAGEPNVGKSTVLNALVGNERAIVTPHAGTTRDLVTADRLIAGLAVRITDTAGLRESTDEIEQEGIRRSRQSVEAADLMVWITAVADAEYAARELAAHDVEGEHRATVIVHNKIDLHGLAPKREEISETPHVYISALHGEGIDLLTAEIAKHHRVGAAEEGEFLARQRHLAALDKASDELHRLSFELPVSQPELVAESLRYVSSILEEITGVISSEDLLGEIFATFCIGK